MEDSWKKEWNDKMSGYSEPAPDGMLENILAEYDRRKHAGRKAVLTVLLGAAAAAAVALAVLPRYSVKARLQEVPVIASLPVRTGPDNIAVRLPGHGMSGIPGLNPERKPAAAEGKAVEVENGIAGGIPEKEKTAEPRKAEPADTGHRKAETRSQETRNTEPRNTGTLNQDITERFEREVKETKGSGVSLSLFASGASGGGESSHTGYSSSVERTAAAAPMNYGFGENALAGIMMFNTSKEVNTRTKHYLPVKTGISVTYGFSPRWYIGTGLTYSYLLSDSRTGSDAYYIDSRQAVHYLGIPLNIGYSIWKSSRVQIYASAGGMLEKCLGGTVRNSYVYSNDLRSGETEKLSITPLQWSVSAAAGLQLRLTEYVGIYVEPGVSYHFRNGSGIETSYSARPLDFSLSIGLRFSFERK